jgi:hypothetical protein
VVAIEGRRRFILGIDHQGISGNLGTGGPVERIGQQRPAWTLALKSLIDGQATHAYMEFIETPTFTRLLTALLTDDEYAGLQNVLVENPERGDIIKSGGVRAIYYWLKDDQQIYMLLIYPKSKKDDLTDRETALLREFVKEL